jgi:hypothetical protein
MNYLKYESDKIKDYVITVGFHGNKSTKTERSEYSQTLQQE